MAAKPRPTANGGMLASAIAQMLELFEALVARAAPLAVSAGFSAVNGRGDVARRVGEPRRPVGEVCGRGQAGHRPSGLDGMPGQYRIASSVGDMAREPVPERCMKLVLGEKR